MYTIPLCHKHTNQKRRNAPRRMDSSFALQPKTARTCSKRAARKAVSGYRPYSFSVSLGASPSMLPRTNRIPRKEFPSYPLRGIRVSSPLFSAIVYPREHGVRFSVVVSKKTAATAVVRNRIRRRLYAAVEPLVKTFTRGATIVLYPTINAEKAPLHILKREIAEVLRKQNMLS